MRGASPHCGAATSSMSASLHRVRINRNDSGAQGCLTEMIEICISPNSMPIMFQNWTVCLKIPMIFMTISFIFDQMLSCKILSQIFDLILLTGCLHVYNHVSTNIQQDGKPSKDIIT